MSQPHPFSTLRPQDMGPREIADECLDSQKNGALEEKRFIELMARAKSAGWGPADFPKSLERQEAAVFAGFPPANAPATITTQTRFLPLHWAVALGFSNSAIFLCAQMGFDPNETDARGADSALLLAIGRGQQPERVGVLLVELGADVNLRSRNRGQSPLDAAVVAHALSEPWLDFLVQNGAELESRDTDGRTPLSRALNRNRPQAVRRLLQLKADPRAVDFQKKTPLHWAASHGAPESCAALLDAGASAADRDCEGKLPLHAACESVRPQRGVIEALGHWMSQRPALFAEGLADAQGRKPSELMRASRGAKPEDAAFVRSVEEACELAAQAQTGAARQKGAPRL